MGRLEGMVIRRHELHRQKERRLLRLLQLDGLSELDGEEPLALQGAPTDLVIVPDPPASQSLNRGFISIAAAAPKWLGLFDLKPLRRRQ